MKKDRNCGETSYPVYPAYPGMIGPGMMGPGMPMYPTYGYAGTMPINTISQNPQLSQGFSNNNMEQQINQLQQQINSLDRRVSRLENNTTNNNSSFSSNYQMM